MSAQLTIDSVSARYGAPMGRSEWRSEPQERLRLFRVRIDQGGYDQGGAYWGLGEPLWCCTDGLDFRRFLRSPTRARAKAEFIDHLQQSGCQFSFYR